MNMFATLAKRLGRRPTASIKSASFSTAASQDPNLLHYEWIRPTDATISTTNTNTRTRSPSSASASSSTIVFLHGLLGNGRNIKTMANKLCAMKQTNGLLLDITGHGRSPHNPTASFADAVADIQFTVQHALAQNSETKQEASVSLVGHSLGGRLSLYLIASQQALAASAASSSSWRPKSVWLLDTVPGIVDSSVVKVLQSANAILQEASIETRKHLIERLRQDRHSEATCQWLAAQYNVKTKTFTFDVDTAESLVRDFERHDFWDHLESLHQGSAGDVFASATATARTPSVHLVQAGRNTAWENSLPKVQDFAAQNRLQHYTLPNAGHWVHIDDLPGLLHIFDSVEDW